MATQHKAAGTGLTGPLRLRKDRDTDSHVAPVHTFPLGSNGLVTNVTRPLTISPTAGLAPRQHIAPYDLSFVAAGASLSTVLTAGTITVKLFGNGILLTSALITAGSGNDAILFSKTDMLSFVVTSGQTWAAEIVTTDTMAPATNNDLEVMFYAS